MRTEPLEWNRCQRLRCSARTRAKNQCRGNEVDGILSQNGAHSKVEGNVCEQNKNSGISVIGSGVAPELANNQCRSNGNAGIYFDSGSSGRAENNTCERKAPRVS